jgi:hypothetical protein
MQYSEKENIMENRLTRKMWSIISLAVVLALVFAPLALADNVQNDVVAGGNDTITAGGSTVVNYRIAENSGDGEKGCNATVASPATVNIIKPSGVTSTPASLTFTSCGTDLPVVFTSTIAGNYEITVSVSDSGPGTYNTIPAKFTLKVNATVCTAPIISNQPATQNITYGGDATFSAAASGDPAPSVQWQVNTDGINWTDIPGATSTPLTVAKPTVSESGSQYRAVFTNTCSPFTATSSVATLTVSKATASVTADNKNKTYGDANPALTATVVGEVDGGDAINYSLSTTAEEFSDVDGYPIVVTLGSNPNYNVTPYNGTLTVNARPITVTADAKTKIFGDADPALTYQVTSGSLAFSDAFTGGLTRAEGENVGAYAIQQGTVALNDNYTLTYVGADLTIGKRAVEITADAKSKV